MASDTMARFLWLFVAGGFGVLARYNLGGFVQRISGSEFPLGTFVVNVLGCLLFGFVWTLADERMFLRPETRIIVLTGFLGAFTTFSTFAFETDVFLRESQWLYAALNAAAHNTLGFAGVVIGMSLGRLL